MVLMHSVYDKLYYIYVVSIGILHLKLHHLEVGMLFNAWLSEDEQVFKGMQDRTGGYCSYRSGYRINVVTNSDAWNNNQ